MIHLGDITKIDGHDIPIVDVVTGGSPCQDLSVAGLRKGLAGERSGLFLHQIRIIKEMRDNDRRNGRTGKFIRPNWGIWENVPGALSSAPKGKPKGSDFQAVLQEFCKIVCEEAPPVPIPPKGWPNAGCISGMGDGGVPFSVSWRMVDAQFWGKAQYLDGRMLFRGTPQRRRRLALVADFGGIDSPEVLFERASLFGDTAEIGETGQRPTSGSERSLGETSYTLKIRGGVEIDSIGKRAGKGPLVQEEKSGTLGVSQDQTLITIGLTNRGCESGDVVETVRADPHGAYPMAAQVYDARGNGDGEVVPTLTGDHQNRVTDYTALCIGNGQADQTGLSPLVGALNCMHDQQAVLTCGFDAFNQDATGDVVKSLNSAATDTDHIPVVFGIDRAAFNQGENAKFDFQIEEEKNSTLTSMGPSAVNYESVVRRLTPRECERLQGYDDDWTDIGAWTDSKGRRRKTTDSNRYKALGNSICLPWWQYLARRICARYERPVTLGSLFDGIGGFPVVFSRCGAVPVWASEIEDFCVAVTKKRFPEVET